MTLIAHINALVSAVAADIKALYSGKQNTLVSGTSIKTINGLSLLGSGDMVISGGAGGTQQVFIQDTQPADTGSPYIWIQTGLPNGGVTVWYNSNGAT